MPAVILLLCVSAVPTIAGLSAAVWYGLDVAALQRVLDAPGVGLSIATSIWSGVLATAVSLLLAHLAVAVAVTGGWRRRLNNLALPLLSMPHLAVGIGLVLVLAPSGILMRLISPWATGFELPPDWLTVRDPAGLSLMTGLIIKETAFLVIALVAALAQVPAAALNQQARMLGYGPLKGWFVAVAPLLQRQIRLPVIAVLVFGISNVELAIPLGPDLPPTFAVMLWRWFVDPDPAIHAQAFAGALLLFAVTGLCVAAAAGGGKLTQRLLQFAAGSGARRNADQSLRRLINALLATLWIVGMLTVIAVALRSAAGPWRFPQLLPTGSLLSAWRDVLPIAGSAATTTVGLAALTAIVAAALVLPAAEQCRESQRTRRIVSIWLFLPLLVPQMTFLFGVQVLLARLHIDGTFAAVVWAHLIFVLPYLWGVLAAARASLDPRFHQLSRTLGASPLRTWLSVTLPLLARSTLLALALAFSVSVATYLPTLFAGAGRISTAATEAAAAASSGSMRLAAVHAMVLALAPLAAFAAAYAVNAMLFRNRRGVAQ